MWQKQGTVVICSIIITMFHATNCIPQRAFALSPLENETPTKRACLNFQQHNLAEGHWGNGWQLLHL